MRPLRTPAATVLALPLLAMLLAPALAEPLPPGLQSARLLPGWQDAEGNRIAALDLRLEPGWKTYWRSPGDSGLPPVFDWQGSQNLADVTFHWPAPEAIRSGDDLTLGYHDRLVLPFTARAADPSAPLTLTAQVDLGLCEKICVPVHVRLTAPDPQAAADPVIEAALARVPATRDDRPTCRVSEIADGMRLAVDLAGDAPEVVAIELAGRPEIWVSGTRITPSKGGTTATADLVPPSGAPFDLDADAVRITLIAADGAAEMQGCAPQG